MARSKQTARKSTGGRAPRMQLATKAARNFKSFMTSQQSSGSACYASHTPQAAMARQGKVVKTSFINHENTMGEFKFPVGQLEDGRELVPRFVRSTAVDPVTGNTEDWLGVNFRSCYDDAGMQKRGRPPIELVLVLDISGSMSWGFDTSSWGTDPAKSKLAVAKRCIKAILAQLTGADSVGIVLFNTDSHTLIPLTTCDQLDREEVAAKVDGIATSGGTRLSQGFNTGVQMIASKKRKAAAAKGQATKAANMAAKAGGGGAKSKKQTPKRPKSTAKSKDATKAAKLADAAAAAGPEITNRRVMFLTDMESGQEDEEQVLAIAKTAANGRSACHTTVVGIGVDVSVGTVQTLSKIPGCKYFSVSSASEFEEAVASEFAYDVTPIAFNLDVALTDGRTFAKAFGSSELNDLAPGATSFKLSSEFPVLSSPSREASGAMYLFKLQTAATAKGAGAAGGFGASLWNAAAAATAAILGGGGSGGSGGGGAKGKGKARRRSADESGADIAPPLAIKTTWTSRAGIKLTDEQLVSAATTTADQLGVRKGIALVRYVDLQAEYVLEDDGDDDDNGAAALAQRKAKHVGWVRRFQQFKAWFVAEMAACKDKTIGKGGTNVNIMDTINQIIELERKEAAGIETKEAAAAAVSAAAAADSTSTTAAGSLLLKDMPNEFLCPITSTLMVDPVIAVDGQSYERAAITQWFGNHARGVQVLSPMTNKPLPSRALVPNLSLRKLIQDHVAKQNAKKKKKAGAGAGAGAGPGGRLRKTRSSSNLNPAKQVATSSRRSSPRRSSSQQPPAKRSRATGKKRIGAA